MGTLTGKLLRIDLTRRTAAVEEVSQKRTARFISARGLGVRYLYDELPAGVDPLGPDNKLIFLIGALGGTGLQGFSKWTAVSKSPLTGTVFRSFAGGGFGVRMKQAGYDLVIVEGMADGPSYVHVDGDGARFHPADDLRGLDHRRLQEKLKERHGPRTDSACIGPAGENGVRYAVITSGERTASRGGMGAVMGAKNLKAICFSAPSRKFRPGDPDVFERLVKEQIGILKDHPRRKNMNTFGTPYITAVLDKLGVLPVKNFREGRLAEVERIDGGEFLRLKKAKAGCHQCLTRCGGMRAVGRGPFAGTDIDGPEYESIYAFGPLIGVFDPSFIVDANALCDHYGLDTISTGVSVAFAIELMERGIVTRKETDGLALAWNDPGSAFALIEKIGRREGFGRILGEGVARAAETIGRGAEAYAMHIKGLEIPGYDPRAVKGYALSMAVSNIGGSHMYGRPRDELSGRVDPHTEEGKGDSIARVQMEQAVEDSLVACTFSNTGLDLDFYARALTAATGMDGFSSPERLMTIGERIVTQERLFNARDGFGRKDDALPARMRVEPLENAGPSTGQTVRNLDGLLDEYYRALGYSDDGLPTADKLEELGL